MAHYNQKKQIFGVYFKENSYLCTCEPTPSHPARGWSDKGEHYIWECVADALFLAVLKLPQSNLVVKDIAEVDAAGRYIPFPLVCRWLTMPSSTPLGAHYIYQRRGYHSVRSLLRAVEGLKRRTGRSQIPRFSFVVNEATIYIVRFWVFGGYKRTIWFTLFYLCKTLQT